METKLVGTSRTKFAKTILPVMNQLIKAGVVDRETAADVAGAYIGGAREPLYKLCRNVAESHAENTEVVTAATKIQNILKMQEVF